MWAFCGAEHHTDDSRYIQGYRKNNRPKGEFGFDLNRWVWNRKMKSWKNLKNLTIVCPSKWLAGCAKKSLLFRDRKVMVIPNGVDIRIFKPRNKKNTRKFLKLPPHKKIILFMLQSANMPWKGPDLLLEIFKQISTEHGGNDYIFVGYGQGDINFFIDKSGIDPGFFVDGGYFDDEQKLSYLYSAADILLVTSRHETLSNSIMESMSCGTPAAAFNVGGISDLIDNNINGLLVTPFNTRKYSQSVVRLLQNSTILKKMSREARNKVSCNFDIRIIAQEYKNLYESVMKRSNE
jgi:glycosyltransferase involved in cell wall biosynthesis